MATTNAPVIQCDVTRLPSQLRKLPQWVVWKLEAVEGRPKPAKMPYDPRSGKKARADDPKTWATFEAARAALLAAPEQWHGLGFYFWRSDPFIGIDLDDAISETEMVEDWARSILDRFAGAYVEHSQSGRGLHIVVRADGSKVFPAEQDGGKKGKVEIYAGRHYLALTGDVLLGYSADVETADETDKVLELATMTGIRKAESVSLSESKGSDKSPLPKTGAELTAEQTIAAIDQSKDGRRFFGLMEQDSHPGKASEEDLQLACIAARHTRDEDVIIEIMTRSGRMRPKWQEKRGGISWLRMTVRRALAQTSTAQFSAEASKIAPALDVLDLKSDADAANWLVANIWPIGARGWLAGEAKLGKSWLALEMCVAVATGTNFLGHDDYTIRKAANVMYLTEESSGRKIRQRIEMLCAGRKRSLESIKGRIKTIVRQRVQLTDAAWLAQILKEMDEHKPLLVVVDPLRRYHTGDENDATEIAPVLNALARLQDANGGTAVVVVHHSRKVGAESESRSGQNLRGSSDLHAWSDAAIYVSGTREVTNAMSVEVELKDEEAPPNLAVTLKYSESAVRFDVQLGGINKIKESSAIIKILAVLGKLKSGERLSATKLAKMAKVAQQAQHDACEELLSASPAKINVLGKGNSLLYALSSITPPESAGDVAPSEDHGEDEEETTFEDQQK